jgi:hypothetical protein
MTIISQKREKFLDEGKNFDLSTYVNSRLVRPIGVQYPAAAASEIGRILDRRIHQVIPEPLLGQVLSSSDKELLHYLDSLLDRGLNGQMINLAKAVWGRLRAYTAHYCQKQLSTPSSSPGDDSCLMFVWSKGEHYLECEIFESGEVEFFYRNRRTRATWGEDMAACHQISKQIMEKVAIFGE